MKKILLLASVLLILNQAQATKPTPPMDLSRYQQKTEFTVNGIVTPKVVKMISEQAIEGPTLLVKKNIGYNGAYPEHELLPHRIVRAWEKFERKTDVIVESTSEIFEGQKENLADGNSNTFVTFDGDKPVHKMTFVFPQVTEVSSVRVALGKGVLPPKTISIEGVFENGKRNYIERSSIFKRFLSWPPVKVKSLTFTFTSPHLFRVAEVDFGGTEISKMKDELVLFAEEGATYVLYSDPAFGYESYRATDYRPLRTDSKTPTLGLPRLNQNGDYNADFDGDGLNDYVDLCPRISDAENQDIDGNGRGDVCEDPDQDGVNSIRDNCPYAYNPRQKDSDVDGLGDECDNEESRLSENIDYLFPGLFGLVVVVLLGLVWRSLKKGS